MFIQQVEEIKTKTELSDFVLKCPVYFILNL